jgi:hypothetical protein
MFFAFFCEKKNNFNSSQDFVLKFNLVHVPVEYNRPVLYRNLRVALNNVPAPG